MNIEITLKEVNGKQIPAVTSLQVAETFGKEHFHVLRDIRETMDKCSESFTASNFGLSEYTDSTGRKLPLYILSKDGLMMVTMGYTTPEAMRVKEAYIARFNEMEQELAGRGAGMLPGSYADALEALAAEVRVREAVEAQKALAEAQRDEAIRTKAEIGSRREATSMATASAAVRQRDALADKLGEGKHWKSVKAIPWLLEVFGPSRGMYSVVGKKLAQLGERMGKPSREIEDATYGTIKGPSCGRYRSVPSGAGEGQQHDGQIPQGVECSSP